MDMEISRQNLILFRIQGSYFGPLRWHDACQLCGSWSGIGGHPMDFVKRNIYRKPWVFTQKYQVLLQMSTPKKTGTRGFLQTSEWVCSQQKVRF
jgi:hypothetical protein